MHEVLRGLVTRLGPGVFDDPDNFRGALDDVLDESASLGDQNLVVDAVRLGAYASMMTMLGQGGDPSSTVAQAGARLARDRGGDDRVSASWACACLAYAVGAVGEAEVRHYRTARHPPPVAPPTEVPAPVTQARPEVLPPTPAPLPPASEPPPVRGRWVVPVLLVLALVLAGVAGVLGADLLRDDESPETAEPSDSPTTSAPTQPTPPTSTPPTTTPNTTPPDTVPTPVRTTVEHTCGASGTGDCFLTERAGPTTGADRLRRYQEGDTTLQVTCQVVGQEVFSSVLGTTSRIWARTTRGGYVAAIFLDGIDKFAVTTPC
jgi:hypothetical protein